MAHSLQRNIPGKHFAEDESIPRACEQCGITLDSYICSTNTMDEKGTLINVDGIGNRVDCDCPERMCKITPILDWPLPGREYHLVLADDIVGI